MTNKWEKVTPTCFQLAYLVNHCKCSVFVTSWRCVSVRLLVRFSKKYGKMFEIFLQPNRSTALEGNYLDKRIKPKMNPRKTVKTVSIDLHIQMPGSLG